MNFEAFVECPELYFFTSKITAGERNLQSVERLNCHPKNRVMNSLRIYLAFLGAAMFQEPASLQCVVTLRAGSAPASPFLTG